MTKGERSVSKQGHLQPCCHSKDHKADNCKIFYLVSNCLVLVEDTKLKIALNIYNKCVFNPRALLIST